LKAQRRTYSREEADLMAELTAAVVDLSQTIIIVIIIIIVTVITVSCCSPAVSTRCRRQLLSSDARRRQQMSLVQLTLTVTRYYIYYLLHLFNGLFSRATQVSRHQDSRTIGECQGVKSGESPLSGGR